MSDVSGRNENTAAPRRAFSDLELTQLQETGSVIVGHSLIDGVRLAEITEAVMLLGIDPQNVVLHGTGADHFAVTVKRHAAERPPSAAPAPLPRWADCPICTEFYDDPKNRPGLLHAAANVGIERGMTTNQTLAVYMRMRHVEHNHA